MSLTTRKDATPTESQMKLAIAQTLSQSFAYNAPVVVLDFSVNDQGEFEGKFKDAARPRVFSFNIKGQSVTFKPYLKANPLEWFLKGRSIQSKQISPTGKS